MGNASCLKCAFFDKNSYAADGHGNCRRMPPSLVLSSGVCGWPIVRKDHWCGEFAPKPENKDKYGGARADVGRCMEMLDVADVPANGKNGEEYSLPERLECFVNRCMALD